MNLVNTDTILARAVSVLKPAALSGTAKAQGQANDHNHGGTRMRLAPILAAALIVASAAPAAAKGTAVFMSNFSTCRNGVWIVHATASSQVTTNDVHADIYDDRGRLRAAVVLSYNVPYRFRVRPAARARHDTIELLLHSSSIEGLGKTRADNACP